MEDELIYKIDREGEVVILTLILDNITMLDNQRLQEAFTKLLDEGNKNIVLDLSHTNFISSIVLASLVFMLKRSKEAGGNLIMCSIREGVSRVLELTNLDKIFDIFANREEAVKSFTKT